MTSKQKQTKAPLKRKVFVALSGGVDSAVAAALLVKAGYDVAAAYMVNYDNQRDANIRMHANNTNGSCWIDDYRDAVRVAATLNIPILKLDFTKEYQRDVLEYMFSEYAAGRTPNPDVLCNKFIKFGSWLDKAREMGFHYLATGHYAIKKTINQENNKSSQLMGAKDENKDQTYFLHQLNQQQLSHVMFPVGGYLKSEVRSLARRFKLPVANKEESMGICFIGEVPMTKFLETRIKHKPGKIVLSDGTLVGMHVGLPFYTMGQRHMGVESPKSIKSGQNKPLYVVAKRMDTNELVVGYEDDPLLYSKEIMVADAHWISGQPPRFPLQCLVRLRHRQPLQKATVRLQTTDNRLQPTGAKSRAVVRSPLTVVQFAKPQRAATPGQFAVFYSVRRSSTRAKEDKKGECLGGGVIV